MLFTNLTNTEDVREVLLGKNGVATGAAPGLIAVDMNTISALATREIAKELVKAVVSVMASKVTRIGDIGAGQAAKSCNQIVITGTLTAIAEAHKLAQAMSIDADKVREALLGGLAYSKSLELNGLKMLKADYAPGFKTNLHLKDLGTVSNLARKLEINLSITDIGFKLLEEAVQAGYSEKDSLIIYEIVNKNH